MRFCTDVGSARLLTSVTWQLWLSFSLQPVCNYRSSHLFITYTSPTHHQYLIYSSTIAHLCHIYTSIIPMCATQQEIWLIFKNTHTIIDDRHNLWRPQCCLANSSVTVCVMYINVERILPIHRWSHISVSHSRAQFRASTIAGLILDCVRKQENFEGHTCKTSRLNWTYNLPARKKNFIPEESFLHTSDSKLRTALFTFLNFK